MRKDNEGAPLYSAEEVEELFARRLVEQNRRERVNVIEKGFSEVKAKVEAVSKGNTLIVQRLEEHSQRLTGQDEKIAEVAGLIRDAKLAEMAPKERAAIMLMAKKFIFDGETSVHNRERMQRITAGLVIFVPVAVAVVLHFWK